MSSCWKRESVVFEAAAFQVNVGALEHADLGGSQAVAVGGEENSAVAIGFDCGKSRLVSSWVRKEMVVFIEGKLDSMSLLSFNSKTLRVEGQRKPVVGEETVCSHRLEKQEEFVRDVTDWLLAGVAAL